jgi:hypothetical protein
MITDIKDTKDILGEEKVSEILEKEWKTADLPTEDELANEKHESPMARTNVNSRKNLVQYRKNKPKEVKEKAIENLQTRRKRRNVDPFKFIKNIDNDKKPLLSSLLPNRKVLSNADEEEDFYTMINTYLADFDIEELNASDLDDIVNLALNRIIVDRLLQASSGKPSQILDTAASIERYKKQSRDLKQNLAARRTDRVDTKNKQGFSIVDLVFAYDDKRREEFDRRVMELGKATEEYRKKKK